MSNNKYYVVNNEQFLGLADGEVKAFSEAEFGALALPAGQQQVFYREQLTNYIVVDLGGAELGSAEFGSAGMDELALAGHQWLSLRSQLGVLEETAFQLAGRALQILRWYQDHQYCGRCGGRTISHERDLARRCANCALDFYPRLSPCIITLVTRGDYCLLALHSRSKTRRYSCLAGFIEPGESPEQTLAREVMEEAGISVTNIRYHSSQPWPFPSQLMLGYLADYEAGDIKVDQDEILEAQWFRFDQLPEIPPAATISGRLIAEFVRQRKSYL